MANLFCSLFLIIFIPTLATRIGAAPYYDEMEFFPPKHRLRQVAKDKAIKAEMRKGTCLIMRKPGSIRRVAGNSMICRYKGHYYGAYTEWIDNARCRRCICFPTLIGCFQIQMVPTNLPQSCIEDPAGRHSTVPKLGTCLAPLVEVESVGEGRRTVACRDQEFRRSLIGKKWIPDRENPGIFAVAKVAKNSNMKREAIKHKEQAPSMQKLYEFLLESVRAGLVEEIPYEEET